MNTTPRFNGKRLREARKKARLSQSQLAHSINAHFTSVSDWETGKTSPSGRHVASLCRVLEVTAEQLYDDDEEEVHRSVDAFNDLTLAIRAVAREEARQIIAEREAART